MAGRPHDAEEPDDAVGAEGPEGPVGDAGDTSGRDVGHGDAHGDAAAPDDAADAADARPSGREPDDAEVDERWRAIVAELGDLGSERPATPRRRATDAPPPARPGPGARTVRPAGPAVPPGATGPAGPGDAPDAPAPPASQGPTGPTGPRSWSPDPDLEEAEDHFTPPDPGPVLSGDPLLTMAWVAAVGVPVLLLIAVVVWRDIPSVVLTAAGAAFVGAVALLLWRMPHRRDDDDGPGAVV